MSQEKLVLIVDDDAQASAALAKSLRRLGCDARPIADAETAFDATVKYVPDLLVVSAGGALDGFALCDRLRKDTRVFAVPLVLLAAEGADGHVERHQTSATPADAYVQRPISSMALLQRLGQFLMAPPDPAMDDAPESLGTGIELVDEPEPSKKPPPPPPKKPTAPPVRASAIPRAAPLPVIESAPVEEPAPPVETKSEPAPPNKSTRPASMFPGASPSMRPSGGGLSTRDFLELREQLTGRDRELKKARDDAQAFERQLADANERAEGLRKANMELVEKLAERDRQLADVASVTARLDAARADKELANKKAEALAQRLERAKEELAAEREKRNAATAAERQRLEAEHAVALEKREAEHADALEKLRAEHAAALERLKAEHADAVAGFDSKVEWRVSEMQIEIGRAHEGELRARERALDQLRDEHEKALVVLRGDNERLQKLHDKTVAEHERLVTELRGSIDETVRVAVAAEADKWREDLAGRELELRADAELQLAAERKKLDVESEKVVAELQQRELRALTELRELRQSVEEREAAIRDEAERAVSDLRAEHEAREIAAAAGAAAHEARATAKLEAALAEQKASWEARLADTEKKHVEELDALQSRLAEERLSALGDAADQAERMLAERVAAVRAEEANTAREQLEKALAEATVNAEAVVAERHAREKASLEAAFAERLAEAKAAADAEYAALEKLTDDQIASVLRDRDAVQAHLDAAIAAEQAKSAELDAQKSIHAEALAALSTAHEVRISTLIREHEARIESVHSSQESERLSMTARVVSLEKQVADNEAVVRRLEEDLAARGRELENAHERLMLESRRLETATRRIERDRELLSRARKSLIDAMDGVDRASTPDDEPVDVT